MIDRSTLEAAGYRSFRPLAREDCTGYQRIVYDDAGEKKRYFINVYVHDFPEDWHVPPEVCRVSAEVRLYRPDVAFDFGPVLDNTWTLARLEALVASMYVDLRCIPDVYNN
jgi:hypothetical protein